MDPAVAETSEQRVIQSDGRVIDYKAMTRLETRGKTVGEVYRELCVSLRRRGLIPSGCVPPTWTTIRTKRHLAHV
jgi:hypothetical protein